jgi:hypothetical protein
VLQIHWRYIAFALLGMSSGAISATGVIPFTPPDNIGLLLIFVLPGLAFGLTIGPSLAYGGWLLPKHIFVWIIFATLGHFVAAICVTALTWRLQAALPLSETSAIAIAATLAGALGGGILAAANRILVPGAAWIAPTIVGGLLGPVVLMHDAGPILGRLIFYMIWQGSYAAALAVGLPKTTTSRTARLKS